MQDGLRVKKVENTDNGNGCWQSKFILENGGQVTNDREMEVIGWCNNGLKLSIQIYDEKLSVKIKS